MKLSKLLVLSALGLSMAGSVQAGVPDGVWTMPEPQGLEFTELTFDDYTRYYLYNPAAKMFFASGNEWSTRASIAAFGYEVWFVSSSEADAPEGTYEFWDNCQHPDRVLGDKTLFTDDGGSTWVDRAEQANYSWSVAKVGDSYRIQNAALIADKPEFDGKFFGWKGDYADTRLYMIDPADEGAAVDWKAVTAESYENFAASDDFAAYKAGVAAYQAAMDLKAAIEEAEKAYVDVEAASALYNNTASTADEMNKATASLKELTTAKNKLKTAIEEAEAQGFTATEPYRAVLTNLAATKAEIEKAISDLAAALVEWGKTNATWDKPVDMTGSIVNPHFDNGDCTTGWSGDAFGRGGTVADGAEHYSKNYNTYQKITGLAPGIYSIGVNGFYRSGNYGGDAEKHWLANDEASRYAKLYGQVGDAYTETAIANVMSGAQAENPGAQTVTYTDPETEEEVTVYVPNTMAQGDIYFHQLNQYANKLYVAVDETGELTIGVKKTQQIGGDWSLFDDFSLAFYGTGADACQAYITEAMKNFGEYVIEEGTLYTEAYLTAYQEAYQGEKTASSLAEVNAILAGISDAKAALDKNIELWKEYQSLIEESNRMSTDPEYEGIELMGDLMDYVDVESEDILDELALTNEELEAEIAQLREWIAKIIEISKEDVYEGKDMTKYITNPGFDDDKDINSGAAEGWTIDRISGGNVTRGPLGTDNKELMESSLGKMNYCFESWHCHKWDVWQEVKDLPKGMYELQVQGYVRCEVGGYNRGDEIEPNFPSPVYLYMNAAQSQFPSVYSETRPINPLTGEEYEYVTVESWTTENINGYDYPNSMGGAAQCFGWGMYKKQAYGLIAKRGDVFRIGVKMDADQDWWCIWDSFKLIWHEPTAELVQPILEEELAKIDLSKPMGKDVYEQASVVKAAAEEAIASGDGNKMFEALTEVYNLGDAINKSVALFNKLQKASEELLVAIDNSENDDAIREANALYDEITTGIDAHSITDAEAEEYLQKIEDMMTPLAMPNGMANASDEFPVDATSVIKNPSYEENADGWLGSSAARNADATNVEIFGADFDYYQDIKGLPAGTYQVSVQGFYRAGGATEDFKAYQANPDSLNHAFVYAKSMSETDTIMSSKPMTRLAAEAASQIEVGEPSDGYVYAQEESEEGLGDGWIVCNTMTTAGYEFEAGKYANNVVTFKLRQGDVLRIGLVKTTNLANNWAIWDNWQLTYFGASSAKNADGNPSGVETLNAGSTFKVEYFTIDGRKANGLQKGIMIQKVTFDNGAVIVKKIRK